MLFPWSRSHSRPIASHYAPALITPPAAQPVTLVEAKAHIRVDTTDDDGLIAGLIAGAVSYLDGYTGILGRCLEAQTWREDFDRLHTELRLRLTPAIAIESVKYDDAAGVEQTIDPANYRLLAAAGGPFVRFKQNFTYPTTADELPAVRVAYSAGYAQAAGASTVPEAIKKAILQIVGHYYENREAVLSGRSITAIELPLSASMLLAPYRRPQI